MVVDSLGSVRFSRSVLSWPRSCKEKTIDYGVKHQSNNFIPILKPVTDRRPHKWSDDTKSLLLHSHSLVTEKDARACAIRPPFPFSVLWRKKTHVAVALSLQLDSKHLKPHTATPPPHPLPPMFLPGLANNKVLRTYPSDNGNSMSRRDGLVIQRVC